jgi:hypothetical protein
MTTTRYFDPEKHPSPFHGGVHEGVHEQTYGCDVNPKCEPWPQQGGAESKPDAPSGTYDPPPTHYATGKGFDVWDVWDAFDLDRYTAGAIKYLLRAGKKDIAPRLDDLKKAANYVAKAIEMEEKREPQ